jgi:hypothetical protein
MTFTLTVENDAVMGAQQLTFSNNGGTTTASVTVNPLLPTAHIAPGPIAVPPDSVARQFRIRLSNADNVAHDFSLSVTDATVATVPATATILAGATEAVVTFTGLKLGQTALTLASNDIGAQTQQLYVTNEYQEIYKTYTRPLGVVLQEPPVPPQTTDLGPIVSPVLGVTIPELPEQTPPVSVAPIVSPVLGVVIPEPPEQTPPVSVAPIVSPVLGVTIPEPPEQTTPISVTPIVSPVLGLVVQEPPPDPTSTAVSPLVSPMVGLTLGSSVTGINPNTASVGTNFVLTIYGVELQGATGIQFVPDTDVTTDTPVIAIDGNSLTVNVSLASTAPQTQREVRVLAGTEQLPASNGWSMLLQVTP